MNRRKRRRTLRFERLETRVLLAADLFAAVQGPLTELCVASYCETADEAGPAAVDAVQTTARDAVHAEISLEDRGTQEEIVISDLAFAELGGELSAGPTVD